MKMMEKYFAYILFLIKTLRFFGAQDAFAGSFLSHYEILLWFIHNSLFFNGYKVIQFQSHKIFSTENKCHLYPWLCNNP